MPEEHCRDTKQGVEHKMAQIAIKSKSQRSLARRVVKAVGVIIGILILLAFILVIYVQIAWDRPVKRASPQITVPRDSQTVARGEYLYKYSNLCWGCHGSEGSTSAEEPQAGGWKFDLSGFGPGFGVLYASNITQSQDKGIGAWSDGEILRSIREGLDRDGHVLFPVMPFQFYHGMSDQDAEAIVAYLRSLPAVENQVPENQPTFAA
ncbi:MAG TPA: cytochrome c, partial [Anaerolineales bacterium]|nr:cytochrome c [Anaerolineales bacterium]